MGIALSILLYALWSTVFPLGKATLVYSSPIFLTAVRMILAGALLLFYLFVRKRKELRINFKQFFSLFLLGFLAIYLANILEFWGLQHLSAAKTCFIYSLSPFFAAFLSFLHFKEKMNARKWLGMLIGFCGIIPVLLIQTEGEGLFSAFSIFSWPELAIIGAAFSAVYGWVLLRMVVKDEKIHPLTANGTSMALGGVFALIHSLFAEQWTPFPIAENGVAPFAMGVGSMIILSNFICYNLYAYLLRKFTATFLSFIGLLSPIFATLSSWLLLKEKPSPIILLSTAIVCFGLWVVYQAELKQGYIRRKQPSLSRS